jgi:hypothetical protein
MIWAPTVTFPTALSAQTEIVINDEVACPECEIKLTPIATLGRLDEEVSLSLLSTFAVDAERRHIYAAQTHTPGTIVLYDWDGRLVSTFGRVGGGPGEFGASPLNFRLLLDERGYVHVLDSGRRTVIGPGLSEFVRTHRVPFAFAYAAVLRDARLLLTASALRTLNAPRYALLDSLGAEIRRFGPSPENMGPVNAVRAADGGFWSPYLWRYQIDRYGPDGSLELIVRRDADWFAQYGLDDSPPAFSRPTFARAWEDGEGRLWTAVRVPDVNRERAQSAVTAEMRLDQVDFNAVQDSRIEVIDPASGVLLATRLFDNILHLVDGGFVIELVETPEGLVQAVVSTLSLTTKEES